MREIRQARHALGQEVFRGGGIDAGRFRRGRRGRFALGVLSLFALGRDGREREPKERDGGDEREQEYPDLLGDFGFARVEAGAFVPAVDLFGEWNRCDLSGFSGAFFLAIRVDGGPLQDAYEVRAEGAFQVAMPARRADETAHEGIDVLGVLGDEVEIEAAPPMFREHADVVRGNAAGRANRKIVVAFIDQEDRAIGFILPALDVDMFPARQLTALYGLEPAIVANRPGFFYAALAHPFEGIEGFACAIGTSDEIQHIKPSKPTF